jgi:hypothetical protein
MTRASLLTDLFKAGARHSKTDLARLQKLHDLSVELGAGCTDDEAAAKLAGGDELSKALSENTALKSQLSTLGTRLDSVMAKVDQIAAQPGAPKAALLVVRKDQDGLQNTGTVEDEASAFAKTLEGMSAPERARELMKLSLRLPINGHPDHRPA